MNSRVGAFLRSKRISLGLTYFSLGIQRKVSRGQNESFLSGDGAGKPHDFDFKNLKLQQLYGFQLNTRWNDEQKKKAIIGFFSLLNLLVFQYPLG